MINYVEGDATDPQGDGTKFIIHCCNDVGAWGSGFVLAVSARWPKPERHYRVWSEGKILMPDTTGEFTLGECQFVDVATDLFVVNMIGQTGTIKIPQDAKRPPIRYWAIDNCLYHVALMLKTYLVASVHCPRFGADRAGGHWDEIEAIMKRRLGDYPITVYDLPKNSNNPGAV